MGSNPTLSAIEFAQVETSQEGSRVAAENAAVPRASAPEAPRRIPNPSMPTPRRTSQANALRRPAECPITEGGRGAAGTPRRRTKLRIQRLKPNGLWLTTKGQAAPALTEGHAAGCGPFVGRVGHAASAQMKRGRPQHLFYRGCCRGHWGVAPHHRWNSIAPHG